MNKISVMVCNRKEAESAIFNKQVAIISLYTPGDTPAIIKQDDYQVLHLCCHDLDDPKREGQVISYGPAAEYRAPVTLSLFSDGQALQVIGFVEAMIAKGIKHFIVHCDAGISRSPGVAVALKIIYNYDRSVPYRYQLFNTLVCSRILKAKGLEPFQRPETFSI